MVGSREVVVVTGASAGVGRAVAIEFARGGACVALLARGPGLEDARREVEAAGGRGLAVPVDVADAELVDAAAAAVEQHFGPIDVWVNNAMATILAPIEEITPEEFRRATEVTYLGAVWGSLAALRRMLPRNSGVIVQVGSALAYRAIPFQAPYCGAKHAMRGFTNSLRSELIHKKSKVHVTMVQLPALNTPQFEWCLTRLPRHPQPVPPIYQPEVAARAIVWAAHHRRREVWIGVMAVASTLANRLVPGLLDRYLGNTGYDSQQLEEPVAPNRPANLHQPVPGLHRTHGRFDERASGRSLQLWLSTHRPWVAAGSAGTVVATFLALWGLV